MSTRPTENTKKIEEPNSLMEAFDPRPLEAEQPVQFYWEEPCQYGDSDDCVQKSFEH